MTLARLPPETIAAFAMWTLSISKAFITPDLVKAAIEGSLPRGIGVANLREAPARSQQRAARTVLEARDRGHLRAYLVRQLVSGRH